MRQLQKTWRVEGQSGVTPAEDQLHLDDIMQRNTAESHDDQSSIFTSPFANDDRGFESEAEMTRPVANTAPNRCDKVSPPEDGRKKVHCLKDIRLKDLSVNGLAIGTMLGTGSFGTVYLGHHAAYDQVAIKLIPLDGTTRGITLSEIKSEILAGMTMRHPNIVRLYESRIYKEAFDENAAVGSTSVQENSQINNGTMILDSTINSIEDVNEIFASVQAERSEQETPDHLVFLLTQEFCNGGTLHEALKRGDLKTSGNKLKRLEDIALSVAYAIQYMHQNQIVHRDLSNNNVMLHYPNVQEADSIDALRMTAKLIDFGRVSINAANTAKTDGLTTISYAAPELMSDGHTSKASDIFSLGVLIWEVWTGKQAWDEARPVQIIYAISKGERLSIPEDMPPSLADLMTRCWLRDPHERPSIGDVVNVLESLRSSDS